MFAKTVCLLVAILVHNVLLHKLKPVPTPGDTNSSEEEDLLVVEDHRFFLHEIFNKYGSDGVMSFEGFEHLLENLGLGRLSFEKSHNVSVHHVNGTFLEVHDELALHRHHHDHEHETQLGDRGKRGLDLQEPAGYYEPALAELVLDHEEDSPDARTVSLPVGQRCLSAQTILATYGLEPHHGVVISPVSFLHLCPAIVYELDHRSCFSESDDGVHTLAGRQVRPSKASAWTYASISVLAISLTGLLGVAVVPLVQRAFFQQLLHFLVALAVGTLCGDALLHLLPHALESSTGPDSHTTPVLRAATAFAAMALFFLLEAGIRLIRSEKDSNTAEAQKENTPRDHVMELGPMLSSIEPQHHHHHHHQPPSGGMVSSVAWMVIMGDGLHNLTDGLAIGAAFAGDTVAGFATTLAVFCHELPHELGDFAVLLKSGMSVRRALFYNIVSSVLSFIGMVVGVWVGDHEETALWIYAATAGIFLYIGLSDLIPEMNNNLEGSRSLLDLLIQLSGIITGGGIMLAIALYEEDLHSIFK